MSPAHVQEEQRRLAWPYALIARCPTACELEKNSLALKCGQRVRVDYRDQNWLWGHVVGKEETKGWFPAQLLLAPPPPWEPPSAPYENERDTSEPVDNTWGNAVSSTCVAKCNSTSATPLKAPVSEKVQLQVVTFGVEDAGIRDTSYEVLNARVRAYAKQIGHVDAEHLPDCSFHLDARCFWDPHAGSLKRHVGTHPMILQRLVLGTRFKQWLMLAKRLLLEHKSHAIQAASSRDGSQDTDVSQTNRDPCLTVMVFCKSGKHRAIAASTILRHLAATRGGLDCLPPINLSLQKWGGCECDACSGQSGQEVVQSALRQAEEIWNQLPFCR